MPDLLQHTVCVMYAYMYLIVWSRFLDNFGLLTALQCEISVKR